MRSESGKKELVQWAAFWRLHCEKMLFEPLVTERGIECLRIMTDPSKIGTKFAGHVYPGIPGKWVIYWALFPGVRGVSRKEALLLSDLWTEMKRSGLDPEDPDHVAVFEQAQKDREHQIVPETTADGVEVAQAA